MHHTGPAEFFCVLIPIFCQCILIRQPDLPCPESRRPVIVLDRLIETVLAVRLLKLIGKLRQIV